MKKQIELTEDAIWNIIKLARHPKRPTAMTLVSQLITDFVELHGDRQFGDDPSMVTGIGFFEGHAVTIIAEEKGTNTEEKIRRNFGMPHPEGYRKALRLMKQAEKFSRPILLFIDTPGAFPGLGAEERGQGQAIALNLFEMIDLKVPLIAVVVSEGGSGGALAIGVADRIYMFENSIYSIISPEGFASILFKDSTQAKKAASIMKLTAQDLLHFKIIDTILPEVQGGMQENITFSLDALRQTIKKDLKALTNYDPDKLLQQRYKKYRSLGAYEDKALIEKETK
jgi:acetyl-CoA carboxylase carboxyl transferase subunit alpha